MARNREVRKDKEKPTIAPNEHKKKGTKFRVDMRQSYSCQMREGGRLPDKKNWEILPGKQIWTGVRPPLKKQFD